MMLTKTVAAVSAKRRCPVRNTTIFCVSRRVDSITIRIHIAAVLNQTGVVGA